MKIRLSLCLATLFSGLLTARGQMPATATRSHSLSLEVETTSVGGATSTSDHAPYATHTPANGGGGSSTSSWKKLRSSQTETTKESETLQITVRNFGPTPDTAQVEWYFVAKPIQPDTATPLAKQESIFDHGTQSITVPAGSTQQLAAASSEITSNIVRNDKQKLKKDGGLGKGKAGPVRETGSVMDGWMVRVVADGKVIDAKGSSDALTEVAKDEAQFSALKGQ